MLWHRPHLKVGLSGRRLGDSPPRRAPRTLDDHSRTLRLSTATRPAQGLARPAPAGRVRKGGLEPPRVLPHRILNPARLPVPPLSRERVRLLSTVPAGCNSPCGRGNELVPPVTGFDRPNAGPSLREATNPRLHRVQRAPELRFLLPVRPSAGGEDLLTAAAAGVGGRDDRAGLLVNLARRVEDDHAAAVPRPVTIA